MLSLIFFRHFSYTLSPIDTLISRYAADCYCRHDYFMLFFSLISSPPPVSMIISLAFDFSLLIAARYFDFLHVSLR